MTGKFLKVKCGKCSNEQNIYQKATLKTVACLVCGSALATSSGGSAVLSENTKVLKELD